MPESTFTDDTVLTIAVASAVRQGVDFAWALRHWGRQYPQLSYGRWFREWLFQEEAKPYASYGNGSAMRVAAIGWAFQDLEVVLQKAAESAAVTHNHPEGIKGAQAVAAAILLARQGRTKAEIATFLKEQFGYDCTLDFEVLHRQAKWDLTCQETVPAATVAFLHSRDFEDAIRNAVSLGGDADTLACLAGAMAEAYYGGVPAPIQQEVFRRLDQPLQAEVLAFAQQYGIPVAAVI